MPQRSSILHFLHFSVFDIGRMKDRDLTFLDLDDRQVAHLVHTVGAELYWTKEGDNVETRYRVADLRPIERAGLFNSLL